MVLAFDSEDKKLSRERFVVLNSSSGLQPPTEARQRYRSTTTGHRDTPAQELSLHHPGNFHPVPPVCYQTSSKATLAVCICFCWGKQLTIPVASAYRILLLPDGRFKIVHSKLEGIDMVDKFRQSITVLALSKPIIKFHYFS